MESVDSTFSKNDWFNRDDLLAILPSHLVGRLLQSTGHYDFSGNPVVPVDELSDRIALVQRDFGIEGTAQDENCCRFR